MHDPLDELIDSTFYGSAVAAPTAMDADDMAPAADPVARPEPTVTHTRGSRGALHLQDDVPMQEAGGGHRSEDDPNFNWRRDGNGTRGVVLRDGTYRVVDGKTFDELSRQGKLSDKTPKLKGDGDHPHRSSSSSSDAAFEQDHPRADAGATGGTGGQFIKAGSSGAETERVQKAVGAKADGKFGAQTEAKVRAYQKAHGLRVDGIVGHQTAVAIAGGNGKTAKVGALKGSDRDKLARPRKARSGSRRTREAQQPTAADRATARRVLAGL